MRAIAGFVVLGVAILIGTGCQRGEKKPSREPVEPSARSGDDEKKLPPSAEREQLAQAEERNVSRKNLSKIAQALGNYCEATERFPPSAICDKNGKPLLSWRVALLPYLAEKQLFDQFDLNQSWDSAHNKPLLAKIPSVYRLSADKHKQRDTTRYLAFVGMGAAFEGTKGFRRTDFVDGTSNTAMIAEGKEVPWTKPEDIEVDLSKPRLEVGGVFSDGFHVALADGTWKFIPTNSKNLRAYITRAAGDLIVEDDEKPKPPPQPTDNLKAIGLALHDHHDHHRVLPANAIYDKNGKALLSWRVAILPYLGPLTHKLYTEFKLDEPWDSRHNKPLLAKIPNVYRAPGDKHKQTDTTFYLALVGKNAAFEGTKGLALLQFTDGTTTTIVVAEGGKEVPWTKPEDIDLDRIKDLSRLGGVTPNRFQALFADGSVYFLPTNHKNLEAYLTRNGGEAVERPD